MTLNVCSPKRSDKDIFDTTILGIGGKGYTPLFDKGWGDVDTSKPEYGGSIDRWAW